MGLRYKTAICFLLFLLLTDSMASVYDAAVSVEDRFLADNDFRDCGAGRMKYNGSPVEFRVFRTKGPPSEVIAGMRESRKACLLNNDTFKSMVIMLYMMISGETPEEFDYFIQLDKHGNELIVMAGLTDGGTLIAETYIGNSDRQNPSGYDDGIFHFNGAVFEAGIETANNDGTTNFANIYSVKIRDSSSVYRYYCDILQKDGWNIIYASKSEDFIITDKKGKQYFFTFNCKNDTTWIYVQGESGKK